MIEIGEISATLRPSESGIWTAPRSRPVSYPERGHDVCFDIEPRSFWHRHRLEVLLETVRRYPPGGPLFDIGGGNGIVTRALTDAGLESVLLNPDMAGVRNARERGVQHLICATLEDCRFHGGTLPAAGAFDVIEHVADEGAFLAAVQRALVPGGVLYLTVPAYRSLWSHHDERAGHFRRYRLGSLIRRLSRIGFTIERASYFFAPLVLPILCLRSLPFRLGLARTVTPAAMAREHQPRGAATRYLLNRALKAELALIRRDALIPFGSSCLVVARKTPKASR